MTEIESIRAAILEGADGETVGALPLPQSFRAAVVRADEQEMFAGLPSEAKDPRKSTHVEEVALPELAPDEAYVAVMASAINFNTVWTSIFEPLPTFQFLQRLGKESVWGKRHDQPFHVMGSDASGVILRVGSAVRNWKPGDRVTLRYSRGPKKVKEVLERMRVPAPDRAGWPVVIWEGRVIWIRGAEAEPEMGIHIIAEAMKK